MPHMVYFQCHVDRVVELITLTVIVHFTCLKSLGRVGCRIVTRPFFSGRARDYVLSWRHVDCFLSSQLWHLRLASKCNNTTHFSRRMSACQHGMVERMRHWMTIIVVCNSGCKTVFRFEPWLAGCLSQHVLNIWTLAGQWTWVVWLPVPTNTY